MERVVKLYLCISVGEHKAVWSMARIHMYSTSRIFDFLYYGCHEIDLCTCLLWTVKHDPLYCIHYIRDLHNAWNACSCNLVCFCIVRRHVALPSFRQPPHQSIFTINLDIFALQESLLQCSARLHSNYRGMDQPKETVWRALNRRMRKLVPILLLHHKQQYFAEHVL